MKRKKMKFISTILYICGISFLTIGFVFAIIISSSNDSVIINDLSSKKTVSDDKLKSSLDYLNNSNLNPILYDNFEDAVTNAKYFPTSFVGKLTHYGPDCALCGGHLGCNGQDARNGNIYYTDEEYGTLRIVATSKLIPCGSIIRINLEAYDYMYAIVLDRGVSGAHVDLLKTSETTESPVRTTKNVVFDIVRYGY